MRCRRRPSSCSITSAVDDLETLAAHMILDPSRLPRNLPRSAIGESPQGRRRVRWPERSPTALRLAQGRCSCLPSTASASCPRACPCRWPLRLARLATAPIRLVAAPFRCRRAARRRALSRALTSLGPSYIKLGQFLATRADVIGPELARRPGALAGQVAAVLAWRRRAARSSKRSAASSRIISSSSARRSPPPPSRRCTRRPSSTTDGAGARSPSRSCAPASRSSFRRDLDSYYFAARQIERFHPPSRRLKPVAVVDTLRARPRSRWTCGSRRPPSPRWRRTSRATLTSAFPRSTGSAPRAAC